MFADSPVFMANIKTVQKTKDGWHGSQNNLLKKES